MSTGTMLEPGRLDWTRANLVIGDASYSRAHFWGDGWVFHAVDVNGNPIGDLTVRDDEDGNRTVERLNEKTMVFTGTDGQVWSVTKAGCNCGG